MDVLERIRRLLKERNWSVYRLSKISDIPQTTLNNIFQRNNTPTIPTLEQMCKAFGITLSQFFAETDDAVFLTEEQRELLDTWSTLSKEQKEALTKLIKNM